MIRALFFDLDGTLLDSHKRIPSSARAAIADCRRKGVYVFFATARSPRLDQTLGWTEEEFSLFDGGIYANGACIRFGGEEHYSYIEPDAVRFCMKTAAAYDDVHLSLHMPHEGYAFNFPVDVSMNESWGLAQARICKIDENAISSTVKILLFYDCLTDSARRLPAELGKTLQRELAKMAKVYITDEGCTIQVSGMNAGKLKAIEYIRQQLLLSVEEVCVLGDDLNDMEMILYYPHSVAMGNAVDAVKAAARLITRTNDDDGIAYALNKLLC